MITEETRDSSNCLTLCIADYNELKYFWLKRVIRKKFNLRKISKSYMDVFGDLRFQDFECQDGKISIEWSIWLGFYVTALDEESEKLVYSIMDFLRNKYCINNV